MSYENYRKWKNTPLNEAPYLSIVIPAYNEQNRIVATIGTIASYVSDLGFPWELLIADDGSRDLTVRICEELGFVNMFVLKARQNGGKGSAIQRGMLAARGKYVLFADADNCTPIEEISNLLDKLEKEGFDVVVGSRADEDAKYGQKPLLHRMLNSGLYWIVKNILHIGVRDAQCGFKMYTSAAAHKLYGRQTIMGFSFDLEILYLAFKYGYKVAEVPVAWVEAPGSKADTFKEVQIFLRDLVKIWMNDWKGVYRT